MARGDIPCDILIVGEAPGPSEDSIGSPFVGPAGRLLNKILLTAIPNQSWRIAFTNLVCCIPKDEVTSKKFNEPPKFAIQACEERLIEFVQLCTPKLLILAGKLSQKHVSGQSMFGDGPVDEYGTKSCSWLEADEVIEFCNITHPAAILRMESDPNRRAMAPLEVQRCVVAITEAVGRLVPF